MPCQHTSGMLTFLAGYGWGGGGGGGAHINSGIALSRWHNMLYNRYCFAAMSRFLSVLLLELKSLLQYILN